MHLINYCLTLLLLRQDFLNSVNRLRRGTFKNWHDTWIGNRVLRPNKRLSTNNSFAWPPCVVTVIFQNSRFCINGSEQVGRVELYRFDDPIWPLIQVTFGLWLFSENSALIGSQICRFTQLMLAWLTDRLDLLSGLAQFLKYRLICSLIHRKVTYFMLFGAHKSVCETILNKRWYCI